MSVAHAIVTILLTLSLTMPTKAATFAYVGNADSQDITVLHLADDGGLTLLETVAVPGEKAGSSLPLAISPDKSKLHAATRGEPFAVSTFSIDPASGRLALIGTGPLADSMAYIATDRSGRYLLGASYSGHKVAMSPLDPQGVAAAATQVFATAPNAHLVVTDPSNRYALVTSLGGNLVHQLKFDADTGSLTENDPPSRPIPGAGGPRHLTFSPDQRFVYVLGEHDAAVSVLPWEAATGTLGPVSGLASALPDGFSGKVRAADIHITPDGRFLYASERAGSTLAGFAVDAASGALTPLGTIATEGEPRAFAIDPAGRFLLVVGEHAGHLTSYAIDRTTGRLTAVAGADVGRKPNWVEIVTLP